MDASLWTKLHGGSTHFPIALMIASALFDLAGTVWRRGPHSRDLHAAGFWALLLGALACLAAVLSGLLMTNWEAVGQGTLARHHLFVWPAFALMVGLAVWRVVVGDRASCHAFGVYLIVSLAAAGLMATAGYWGGELLLGG